MTPVLAIVACLALMLGLPAANWWRFGIWLAIGLGVYAAGGARRRRWSSRDPGAS